MAICLEDLQSFRTEVNDDPYEEALDIVCSRCRNVIGKADHWTTLIEIVRGSLDHRVDGTCSP